MQTYLECVGCLARQAVEIACANLPPDEQEGFVRTMLERLARCDYTDSPPIMAMEMYAAVRDLAGIEDPYAAVKAFYTDQALELYPQLKERVAAAADPVDCAMRIAVAGNIIDFGAGNRPAIEVERTLEQALTTPFAIDHSDALRQRIAAAGTIVYLCDNAGETVFDRILIETIGPQRVICAVRALPIINDATLDDAARAGLSDICRVVSSGSPAPGTPLAHCSAEFRDLFARADMVISKGQGNFETLSPPPRDVFFLLMVKCPVISREVGVPVGSFIALQADGRGDA